MENSPVPIIQLENITRRFPGVVALDGINMSIQAGEIHAIIGENGAGKTTLMNLLAGELQPDEGTIYIKGLPQVIPNSAVSQSLGISVVFQELALCPNLTIAENISLWKARQAWGLSFVDRKAFNETARQALAQLSLTDINLQLPVSQLSVAKQQLVEIAKAISTGAAVLILDEPNSALTKEESDHLFQVVRQLKSRGVTILYISHHLEEVLALADRITVLRDGRLVDTVEATGATIANLIARMVGRNIITIPRQFSSESAGEAALQVSGLTSEETIRSVSFNVHPGEFVGIAGLPDSYKDELVECLFGLRPYHGEIRIQGQAAVLKSPADAIRRGMFLIPADRRRAGAFLSLNVAENTVAASLDQVSRAGLMNPRAVQKLANHFYRELDIRALGLGQVMSNLSGGNQQKVILARGLATDPAVLVLHEPTRGIDVGAKAEIYKILQGLAARGSAILIVSSELPELISQCDRILVMHDGRFTGIFGHAEATEEGILACMMGQAVHL